jgi:GH25 family lysozyme M1 (1,4-beta-N-acetylmuramidase)
MSKYGIDVCSYQGNIDWGKVKKAGCKFAVVKCIRKDLTPDTAFRRNVEGCTAQKIPVSVYTYVYENTVQGAVKRAWAAVKACQSVGLEKCMIWWDVEERSVFKTGAENRAKATASIIAARSEVEKAGYSFGVYCDADFYTGMLNADKIGGKWWIAAYHGNPVTAFGTAPKYKKPTIHNELCGWQYCSRGRVPGISGSVDLDIAYDDDFTSLTESTTHKAPVSVQNGAYGTEKNLATLRRGDTGTQVKALQRLLRIVAVDGEFGEITELAVKSLQRSHNIDDDGVVGPKTWPFVIGV